MGEIFVWLADQHGFDHVAMRNAGTSWRRAGCLVLAISVVAVVVLFRLASQPEASILRIAATGVPAWVPAVAFAGLWTGLVMAGYGWLLRHAGEVIRKQT